MDLTAAPTARAAVPSACRSLVPWQPQPLAPQQPLPAAGVVHDVIVTPHPFTLQGQTFARGVLLQPGETLADLLVRQGVDLTQPGWVVRVGGLAVPPHLCCRTRAAAGMLVEAYRVPGKSVIRLVALVALAYFTMGGGFFGAGGLGGALGFKSFAAYAINAGAMMLGSMVINKLLPPPGAGSYAGAGPGTTYSLSGARNGARHFGALGLLFGQVRVAPDFAAMPYSWFEGDDQYQYVQLHAGLNVHTVEALLVGETAIGTYAGVDVTRTGFASGNTTMMAWESVDTVAGGLLDAVTAPGAWVERTSSANTARLQVDLVGQLQYINSKGNPQRYTCDVDMEYRLLPGGAWMPLVGSSSTVELANSTTKPLRRTITRQVAPGQYAVRMRKVTMNVTLNQAANTIEWLGLKSYQADTGIAVARQVVGIKIKASGQLNGTLDQVTWLATSTPCPVWTGSAWVTQVTSNPGALILQFARGEFSPDGRLLWGYGKPDSQIDIEGLQAFMVHCAVQGYRFDHWFTEQVSRRDVLDAVAAAGLATISRHTGKLGVVYMAAGQPIEAVINMANIKRGSMRVDYTTRATAEEIEVTGPERTNAWRAASLRVLAPGVTVPRETARISPAGITTQAGRLLAARSTLAQNIWGRKSVTWEMDLEHLTVRRWAIVALSHDLTQWGHGGRLHACTSAAGVVTITLDAEVPAGSTPHVGLRLPGESAYRVFQVVPFTGTVHVLTLVGTWPSGVALPGATADNPAHDTLWIFDFAATPGLRLRITDIAPTPDLSGARITAVPEPDAFWSFIDNGAYTVPAGVASTQPVTLSNLQVTQQRLTLSYDLTAELDITFDAAGPYDHAQVWGAVGDDPLQPLGTTRTKRFAAWRVINAGEVTVRVQAFDALGRPGAVLQGTHDVVLDAPLVLQGNRLPVAELVPGLSVTAATAMTGHWVHNSSFSGAAAPTSEVRMALGPDGQPAVVWHSTSGTGGDAQGGWNRTPRDAVDPTRPYRFAAWVRCSGDMSGVLYMGCTTVRTIGGAADDNAYFFESLRASLVSGRWYLLAGYVLPANYSGAATTQSGVWDATTGAKVLPGVDYQWLADSANCNWRAYQYYTTGAGAVTEWALPMVHELDGTEPSIAALLAMSARGRVAWLTASSQVFAVATGGSATPASITLTALAQNIEGAPSFAVTAGTATLAGSGTTRTLAYADMATDSVTVQMSWAGISDSITIVKVREGAAGTNGADAVVGLLTNESHVVQTAADGSGGSFGSAGGTFKVFDGLTDNTGAGSVAYSVLSSSGVTISIASTGVYTVSGLSADTGTATLRAVYAGVTLDKVYSIARSKAGTDGASTEVQYGVDGSSWHSGFTSGDLYMRQRVGTGAWSAAIRIVGEDGLAGDDGTYVDYVFRRSASAPATPTGSGVPAGWSADPPAVDGNPLYMSKATKDAAGALVGGWSAPVRLDGAPGTPSVSSSLTRLVANFTADSTGLVDSGQTFSSTMQVLLGSSDDTSNWAISRTSSDASITTTLSGATVTVTGIGTAVESGTVTVTATRNLYPTQVITMQISKGKRAVPNARPVGFGGQLSADSYSSAAATVDVRLNSDGTIEHAINGGAWTALGNWYTPTTAGIGSSHRATDSVTTRSQASGSDSTTSSGNALASLASGITYSLSAATAINDFRLSTANRTVTICGTADATPLATGQLRMTCYADRT